MKNAIQAEGESVQEAIDAALDELGVGPDEVEVEILEESNKSLLGLRKGKAKVLVTVKDEEAIAVRVVEEIVELLGVPVSIGTRTNDDELWVTINGEALAWLIGHHGKTLDALQVLVGAIINKRMKAQVRVVVDVEGYRAQRREEIFSLAEKTIGRVLAGQEPISLRPMSATERKTVHLTASQHEGVTSFSSGTDPDRYVIIAPLKQDD